MMAFNVYYYNELCNWIFIVIDTFNYTGPYGVLEGLEDKPSWPTYCIQVLCWGNTREPFSSKWRRMGSISSRVWHGKWIGRCSRIVMTWCHVTVVWSVIQVCRSEVVYDIVPNKGLESAVKLHIYPPAFHCVVMYSIPPDCHGGVKMNSLNIEGTNKGRITFPFQVYEVKSKWLSCECYYYKGLQYRPFNVLSTAVNNSFWMRATLYSAFVFCIISKHCLAFYIYMFAWPHSWPIWKVRLM